MFESELQQRGLNDQIVKLRHISSGQSSAACAISFETVNRKVTFSSVEDICHVSDFPTIQLIIDLAISKILCKQTIQVT